MRPLKRAKVFVFCRMPKGANCQFVSLAALLLGMKVSDISFSCQVPASDLCLQSIFVVHIVTTIFTHSRSRYDMSLNYCFFFLKIN